MSNSKNPLKPQVGESIAADLHESTWTLQFDETMIFQAGRYVVLPKDTFIEMSETLRTLNRMCTKITMPTEFELGALSVDIKNVLSKL